MTLHDRIHHLYFHRQRVYTYQFKCCSLGSSKLFKILLLMKVLQCVNTLIAKEKIKGKFGILFYDSLVFDLLPKLKQTEYLFSSGIACITNQFLNVSPGEAELYCEIHPFKNTLRHCRPDPD